MIKIGEFNLRTVQNKYFEIKTITLTKSTTYKNGFKDRETVKAVISTESKWK